MRTKSSTWEAQTQAVRVRGVRRIVCGEGLHGRQGRRHVEGRVAAVVVPCKRARCYVEMATLITSHLFAHATAHYMQPMRQKRAFKGSRLRPV